MLSLGLNPQFETEEETVEAYIMHDFDADFYGGQMQLLMCGYLRASKGYPDMETLITVRISRASLFSRILSTQCATTHLTPYLASRSSLARLSPRLAWQHSSTSRLIHLRTRIPTQAIKNDETVGREVLSGRFAALKQDELFAGSKL